ncbi:hypothetical protein CK203_067479 [Vitis vinifera]|uniref:Uncharacterized protein n=1 Tax=Vitis vinifera TaxID=29760 RepID=A0A438EBE7_VITVI|nr:hypothetical protein CK203_067479 [Vitis vinifera]
MRRLYHSRRTNEDVRRAIVGQNFSEKKRRCSTECSGSRSGGGGLRGVLTRGEASDEGWVSGRFENLHPSDDGTSEQWSDSGRAVSNVPRSPIIQSWVQSGAVHHLSPNASPKELRGVGGPGLKSGVMGLKMKGVAASPEAGQSRRPDEVRCSIIGPVSHQQRPKCKGIWATACYRCKHKGGPIFSISRPRPQYIQQKDLLLTGLDPGKSHAPEPSVVWETEDMRKLNGVARISETDKALEEESMRYGRGLCSWGKRVLGISHLNSFNFDRTPGGESFDHSGIGMRKGGGANESSSDKGRGMPGVGAIYDTQTERGMQEDKWEESDLAKFSQFLGFPTEDWRRKS